MGSGAFAAIGSLSDAAMLLGLATTRVAVAFLLVPLFTSDLIPALVRNALFVALALLALLLQPAPSVEAMARWQGLQWALLFGKEAFVGGTLGLVFGGAMWAFEAAGQIIDTKAGSSMAQVMDPLSGHQTSLTGALLARLASLVFMAGGGFVLMAGVLLDSYALWPLHAPLPDLQRIGTVLYEAEFGRIMRLALLIAAPALLLLYLVEAVLGLINRFAQQLNVFSLSMSLKSFVTALVLWLQLAALASLLADDLMQRPGEVLRVLRLLLRS